MLGVFVFHFNFLALLELHGRGPSDDPDPFHQSSNPAPFQGLRKRSFRLNVPQRICHCCKSPLISPPRNTANKSESRASLI